MPIWALIGDDSLTCQKEHGNMHDHHAVTIERDGRTVGHVPENMSGFILSGIWDFLVPKNQKNIQISKICLLQIFHSFFAYNLDKNGQN